MPKKIRVYELAHELGLTNKEALDLCLSLGMGVKSHSSSIEDAQADRARRKADREGLRRPVQPEEPAPPAKKAAATKRTATMAAAAAPRCSSNNSRNAGSTAAFLTNTSILRGMLPVLRPLPGGRPPTMVVRTASSSFVLISSDFFARR